jgi:hypothetical protein
LTVTFTVCDAQQISLSPSDGLLLLNPTLALLRTVRPEQKAPPVLAPLRLTYQTFANRKQVSSTSRTFDRSAGFRYALVMPDAWLKVLCPQPNSGESTRGPPRMGPPIFC